MWIVDINPKLLKCDLMENIRLNTGFNGFFS